MSNRIKNNLKNLVGQTLNQYYSKVKPTISDLRYKQEYQNRIIECMIGEVDDNYITTPETDNPIVKLEHSKEGLVKVPSIKGKTILVDADGNETDTPAEGCRLVSVGEEEDNKLIILSKNKNLLTSKFENGNIGNSGEEYDQAEYIRSNTYNKCSENMNIIVSYNTVFRFSQLFFFDENKNFLKRETVINSIVPKGAKYFRVVLAKKDGSLATNNDLELANSSTQVEFNAKATSYVEPKQHKTEILLKEPLREGDYIEGKKIYRNVKQDGLTLIPLEEPIIEELPNSITLQGFDDTTMYIENTITPTVSYGYNALIPYKQELLNQKEEVETNALDIEQNIIPYLMDMEYNLMLMEDN